MVIAAQLRDWNLATHGSRSSRPGSVSWRFCATLRRQRRGNERFVHIDVGNGRDAHARRLDDVDGVDAYAGADLARRCAVVRRNVGRDDGGDDAAILGANAVAL